jgi:hypothetical protein
MRERDRKRQHPLTHRHPRDDVVDQVRRCFCHAPRPARRAEPAPLARERQRASHGYTARAAQPHKSVGEDAALEKSVALAFDELGQRRAGLRLDLGQEGVEVLLDELIQRRVFGAPTFVVDRVRRWCALNRLAHDRSALSPP